MAEEKRPGDEAQEIAPRAEVTIFNVDPGASNVHPIEDESLFGGDTLTPPLPPRALARRYDESFALRPNIDAYVVNIEGFGHRLEPRIDLNSKDADEKIRNAILMEQIHTMSSLDDIGVSDEEVVAKRMQIERASQIEKLRLEMFFANPTAGMSFVQLRKQMRRDLEVTGNAYIEVVRNWATGAIAQLVLAPAVNMRLLRMGTPTEVEWKRRVSPISYARVSMRRRFRRFVQLIDGTNERVYFKELGDPRIVSARTGRYYISVDAMFAEEEHREQATEMVHLRLHDPQSPYGTPRWQGAVIAVVGSRAAEEVNYAYFDEKTIPPGFLLVSGAPLKPGADKKIEQYLKDHIKGRRNFWSIVVIEAEGRAAGPGQTPPRARIEWVPMTDQQQQDALFQHYDERNGEKIGNMFRLPKLLRGDMKDFNRSTAGEALKYAEQQVFEPERLDIDEMINEVLFPHMDVKYWRFVSNGPTNRSPIELADILTKIAPHITGKEARDVIGRDILHRELDDLKDPWTQVPIEVYRINGGSHAESPEVDADPSSEPVPSDPAGMIDRIAHLRDELLVAAGNEAEAEKALLRYASSLPRERIVIEATEFEKLFVADEVNPG